jgi:hypothetical protein
MGQQVKVANPVKGAGVENKSIGLGQKEKKKKEKMNEKDGHGPEKKKN